MPRVRVLENTFFFLASIWQFCFSKKEGYPAVSAIIGVVCLFGTYIYDLLGSSMRHSSSFCFCLSIISLHSFLEEVMAILTFVLTGLINSLVNNV